MPRGKYLYKTISYQQAAVVWFAIPSSLSCQEDEVVELVVGDIVILELGVAKV